MEEEYDSDGAPEELTFEQGSRQDEKIREVREKNKKRVARENKERRKLWAQRKTQKPSKTEDEDIQADADDDTDDDTNEHMAKISGMLPNNVIDFLASREKQVFSSDSEKEETIIDESSTKKRKQKNKRGNTITLDDLPPPPCAETSLDFLKRRKLEVPRSHAVLNNADQALRLLSSRGGL